MLRVSPGGGPVSSPLGLRTTRRTLWRSGDSRRWRRAESRRLGTPRRNRTDAIRRLRAHALGHRTARGRDRRRSGRRPGAAVSAMRAAERAVEAAGSAGPLVAGVARSLVSGPWPQGSRAGAGGSGVLRNSPHHPHGNHGVAGDCGPDRTGSFSCRRCGRFSRILAEPDDKAPPHRWRTAGRPVRVRVEGAGATRCGPTSYRLNQSAEPAENPNRSV